MTTKSLPIDAYAHQCRQVLLGGHSYAFWLGIERNVSICHIWRWERDTRVWNYDFILPAAFYKAAKDQHNVELRNLTEGELACLMA